MLSDKDILFISRLWSVNRGHYTSIEHFMDYFPDSPKVCTRTGFNFPAQLLKYLANQSKGNAYTSYSAGIELKGIFQSFFGKPKIIFFPYGDFDYFHIAPWAHLLGAKVMIWSFFTPLELRERFGTKSHLQKLDLILTAGRSQCEALTHWVEKEKVAYFPIGVDCDFFTPPEVFSKEMRLIQVGINRRDFMTMFEVAKQLKSKLPALQFDFVGYWPDVLEKDPIFQTYFSDFKNKEWFHVHQNISDDKLRALYQQASLLLLPLKDGGSSNAVNEALACGLPVVATDIANVKDYLHSEYALLCPQANVTAMTEACASLLQDYPKRIQMGKAARAAALSYDWKKIKSKFYALMKNAFNLEFILAP